MSGPDLCPKCKGLHYKTSPCIVRKPSGGSLNGRAASFQAADAGSIPVPASTPKRGPGRPKTITDMAAYKAQKQRQYRAKLKARENPDRRTE